AYRPAPSSSRFRAPGLRACGHLQSLTPGPDQGRAGLWGPIRARMRAATPPRRRRGAQGTPPRHPPAYSPRSGEEWPFPLGRPRPPGNGGAALPLPRPPPPRPDPRPVGRRARPTSRCPSPPLLPAWTSAPWGAAPDRPAGPPPGLAARLNLRPVGRRARAIAFAPPLPAPLLPAWTSASWGAALDRPAGAPPRRRCLLGPPPRGAPRPTDRPTRPPLPSPPVPSRPLVCGAATAT